MKHLPWLLLVWLLMACSAPAEPAPPTQAPPPTTAVVASEPIPTAEPLPEPTSPPAVEEESAEVAEVIEPTAEPEPIPTTEPTAEPANLPAWQTLPLTNARNGDTFTIADLAGKTVFVEPMATWCSNCRRQMGNVQAAQSQLGDDVVILALSVETNISAADLAAYATDTGFDFQFAVMTPEFLQALAAEFGQTVANPPATPHFIIRPDGSFTTLSTGIESADDILRQIQSAQS